MQKFLASLSVGLLLLVPTSALADEDAGPEEVGGWAVINPETGKVHGVIVCTESVCGQDGEWGGVLPVMDYMGCDFCTLRKQTNATADGNVAGWHGSGEGTEVTYDGDEKGSYTIVQESGDEKRTMTLVPEKTATDAARMDLHTGIVEQRTERAFSEPEASAKVTVQEARVDDGDLDPYSVEIEFEEWGYSFGYESVESAVENVESDVEAVLAIESPESDHDADAEVVAEPNVVVQTIRTLMHRVVEFLTRWWR